MSFIHKGVGSYWRPYEFKAAEKHFGSQTESFDAEYFIWRHNTECVNANIFNQSLVIEEKYKSLTPSGKIINPMSSYKYTNNKDACFDAWKKSNISIPNFFSYENREDFESKRFDFPFLLRLNDGVTGEDTYLVENESQLEPALLKVESAYVRNKRINTKKICVQFIDTSIEGGYKTSYRIIVAGNNVIVGYARISDDWLAITKQFTNEKKPHFIQQNKRLSKLIKNNHDEIVRSVTTLGLHHVGIDLITDREDNIYFLELQPFYFSGRPMGHPNPTSPPYWNPYKPQILVDWLVNEQKNLQDEIPLYYQNWLDKDNHFDLCYKSLKESL